MLRHLRLRDGEAEKTAADLRRSTSPDASVQKTVQEIIEDVRKNGDKALLELTLKFDRADLSSTGLRVSKEEYTSAYEHVSGRQISALEAAKKRLEGYESQILKASEVTYSPARGVEVKTVFRPLESVGCYVPGGRAVYPSSLLMAAVPARVARVRRVVVCSPPMPTGEVNPLLLVAADLCKIDEFYKVGGAQAVAALALGTEGIRRVSKIVGPGNIYVTLAKMILSQVVSVDLPAGPSEVLIFADESADPRLIALDLLAQAEHSSDSVCGVVTNSKRLAAQVEKQVSEMAASAPRSKVILSALKSNGFIVVAGTEEEAIKFVNAFAPEHLEVFTSNPTRIAELVVSAGLVLLGDSSPAALSDYCVGSNHILPTGGYARTCSGLSVLDFGKRISVVACSREGLRVVADEAVTLAEAEGLYSHARAVKERL